VAIREINLIPPDITASRLVTRHLYLWAGCLVCSITLLFGLYAANAYLLTVRKHSLYVMKDIPVELAGKVEVMKGLQRDRERLDRQRSALAAIKSRSRPVSQVIFGLSEIMNDDTWLSGLLIETAEGPEKDTRLVLTGLSTSNEHLGDFINRLSADRSFKGVVLKFASESEREGAGQKAATSKDRIRFQIGCQVSRG
jgi:hypothetical protein